MIIVDSFAFMFAGPGIVSPTIKRLVQPADLAPTFAALLGMSPPASARGTALPEVFRNEK